MSSVPLPKRAIVGGKSDTPAVWKTFDSEKASEEECLKEEGSEREVCCKQLVSAPISSITISILFYQYKLLRSPLAIVVVFLFNNFLLCFNYKAEETRVTLLTL